MNISHRSSGMRGGDMDIFGKSDIIYKDSHPIHFSVHVSIGYCDNLLNKWAKSNPKFDPFCYPEDCFILMGKFGSPMVLFPRMLLSAK